MLSVKTGIIKGHNYQCTLFPAQAGYAKGVKLGKIVAGVIESDDPISAIVDGLIKLDKEGEEGKFLMDLFSNTLRDGSVINETLFNEVYSGNYTEMVEALKFIIESNFSDFFNFFLENKNLFSAVKKEEVVTETKA
jgi:hypothetical protein